MTLRQLSERLQKMVTENDSCGRSGFNELQTAFCLEPKPRKPRQHHRNARLWTIIHADNCAYGYDSKNSPPVIRLVGYEVDGELTRK